MSIKSVLRNSKITAFGIYILRYRIIRPLDFFSSKLKIKFIGKVTCSDIEKLHNSKLGEACIIVGNGPSVKMSDLDLIAKSGMDSFAANRIFDILDKTEWCPTYLSVMDPGFILGIENTHTPEEYGKQIENSDIKYAFLTYLLKNKMPECEKVMYIFSPLANLFSKDIMPFSEDSSKYVSDLGNVTPYSIQIAYYLGYRKIYLYGMDGTYPKYLDVDGKFKIRENCIAHIDGMKKDSSDETIHLVAKNQFQAYFLGGYADARKADKGYNMCRDFSEKNGMEIINLTHGGVVENFERQNFYDIFKE